MAISTTTTSRFSPAAECGAFLNAALGGSSVEGSLPRLLANRRRGSVHRLGALQFMLSCLREVFPGANRHSGV